MRIHGEIVQSVYIIIAYFNACMYGGTCTCMPIMDLNLI